MIPKNYKGRCVKKKISKCESVMKLYSDIQEAYADTLEKNEQIKEVMCNVSLDGLPSGDYFSDFVCIKTDGDYMVRECISRIKLCLPRTAKLLDESREYWRRRGVEDWGIVINKEDTGNEDK